jgi:hypothetical protein
MSKCLICGVDRVTKVDQEEHLAAVHKGPHVFFYDAKEYRTEKPSMLVAELLQLVGGNPMYYFHEDRGGKQIDYSQGQAVDLTRRPHFFSVPPATNVTAMNRDGGI